MDFRSISVDFGRFRSIPVEFGQFRSTSAIWSPNLPGTYQAATLTLLAHHGLAHHGFAQYGLAPHAHTRTHMHCSARRAHEQAAVARHGLPGARAPPGSSDMGGWTTVTAPPPRPAAGMSYLAAGDH